MDKKGPFEALDAYYGTIDAADVSALVQAGGRARTTRRWAAGVLGFASACALGACIAVALTYSTPGAPETGPEGTSWGIREQMARNGMNPDELLGPVGRRSEAEEVRTWRA